MSGLLNTFRATAAAHPRRIAIQEVDGAAVTYGQLTAMVEELASELGRTWDRDRPLALRIDHGLDECLLELALLEAGIPVLALPSFFTSDQISHAITACGAQALVTSATPNNAAACRTAPIPLPRGTARITFTSGSTGTPAGICLSREHMLWVARAVIEAVGAGHAGRHCPILPPGILLETVAGYFATLLAGGTYVAAPQASTGLADPFRPDFAKMVRTIAELEITSLILVPEYLAGLVRVMEATGCRLPRLTLVAVGGARTPSGVIERARWLGLPVRQGYGLTECGSVVALEGPEAGSAGSVGRPLGHVRLAIAEDGEILVDGNLCLGTLAGATPEAPLRTGDIGRFDEHGRLWIEGRKSNLIITSFGRNISPEWLEEELMAHPDIAQAMVHGDGLPAPRALLVPAHANADLAVAVAAVNARLPAYAKIGAWREAAHFTPANGMLTGNGRLRRAEIAARWVEREPDFFTALEAATVRERLAFLAVPQVQAGLRGEISLATYLAYLAQAYHHVRHTVPLMQAARERLSHRPELVVARDDYIAEETGHEEWILADIAAAGGNAAAVRSSAPAPATAAMVEHAYRTIRENNPASFFGMVYVLESVSVALASRGAAAVRERLALPPEAFRYLTSHGALDQEHMRFFAGLVNGLSDHADRDAITAMAREMFGLFGGMFASIDLEPVDVAA